MSEDKKSIVIVDDHPMITEGLDSILSRDPLLVVSARLNSAKALLHYLNNNFPDLILLDINMPDMDGIEVARIVRVRYPSVKIVCISAHNHSTLYKTIQDIPVNGFIPKLSDTKVLTETLHKILQGQNIFLNEEKENSAPMQSIDPVASQYKLTKREIEIMHLVSLNKSSKEIAELLFLSPYTVETHRKNICQKLGINTSRALLKFAMEHF